MVLLIVVIVVQDLPSFDRCSSRFQVYWPQIFAAKCKVAYFPGTDSTYAGFQEKILDLLLRRLFANVLSLYE